jgi:lipoyl(octanoyl) transferase
MIRYLYLGRTDYDDGLRMQAEAAEWLYQGRVDHLLLLLEHPPVLTLGRNAGRENVLASDELLAARGVKLHRVSRGGDVTWHGPGQLVGYPIFDLRALRNPSGARMGPVDFVRRMEEALIRVCHTYGVRAGRIAGLTGVWCSDAEVIEGETASPAARAGSVAQAGPTLQSAPASQSESERKIAAIGIHVSRGITSHGFAFNVNPDLSGFSLINPCGITDKPVTTLQSELARATRPAAPLPALEAAAHEAARQFSMVFGEPVLAVESFAALRLQAEAAQPSPTEGVPLRVPREAARLHGEPPPPERC